MASRGERLNPFYVALVVVGVLFAVTACVYFVMALRALQPDDGESGASSLLAFVQRSGGTLMAGELALLAVATVGAIALDEFRQRRPPQPLPGAEPTADADRSKMRGRNS